MEAERQAGKREVEKFVHGIRNGEIVGGSANERRMRHATRAGNKPSFWTYLKESGCRGCQKAEVEETIQHVLGGECEAIGKNKNNKYREEIRRILDKCRKLMNETQNRKGEIQAEYAIQAIQPVRGHSDRKVRELEELALKQMVSGIIPEWQQLDDKKRKGAIATMRLWTGELMN
eukprot:3089145-Pleurochrysis_carterae.AAC.1